MCLLLKSFEKLLTESSDGWGEWPRGADQIFDERRSIYTQRQHDEESISAVYCIHKKKKRVVKEARTLAQPRRSRKRTGRGGMS